MKSILKTYWRTLREPVILPWYGLMLITSVLVVLSANEIMDIVVLREMIDVDRKIITSLERHVDLISSSISADSVIASALMRYSKLHENETAILTELAARTDSTFAERYRRMVDSSISSMRTVEERLQVTRDSSLKVWLDFRLSVKEDLDEARREIKSDILGTLNLVFGALALFVIVSIVITLAKFRAGS